MIKLQPEVNQRKTPLEEAYDRLNKENKELQSSNKRLKIAFKELETIYFELSNDTAPRFDAENITNSDEYDDAFIDRYNHLNHWESKLEDIKYRNQLAILFLTNE